ncbi:MAG: DUF4197 family protein [Undibacterium sp.]|nr:DUF4197 family protein [Opitutaceae bacterium]
MKSRPPSVASLALLVLAAATAPLPAVETAKPAAATTTTSSSFASMLSATGLTQDQFLSGLKTGLGAAVDMAAGDTAKAGAFQMGAPSSMAKLEGMLKAANQTGALDGFKASLNSAAASVAPQAAAALKESVGSLTLASAAGLTPRGSDSATRMLRGVAEPALRAKLMPLVAVAIAANGTAAKAKSLAAKAGPMAAMMGVPGATDLEGYVFTQLLDATFGYVAKGEAAIRANPAMLKDKFAATVFGGAKK